LSSAGAADALGDLVALLGAEHAAPASSGDTVAGVAPRWVAHPGSVDEAAQVIRLAAERGLVITPFGCGAHADLGAPPARIDLALTLARLDGVIEHHATEMTVTVAAGCTLAALDAVLAPAGQWLPLDPPRAARTTIGGLVAANLSGPLRTSQGTARDLLLGVEIVAADGSRVRGGGKVVKNVAGYDLPKLHIGAFGSLGAIVAATFKVRPRPECEQAIAIACSSAAQAGEVALQARDAVEPLWLEAAAGADLAREKLLAGLTVEPISGALVVAGVGGIADEVEDGVARLLRLARGGGLEHRRIEDGRSLRERLVARAAPDGGLVLKAAVLPTEVGRWTGLLRHPSGSAEPLDIAAHAASGVIRAIAKGDNAAVAKEAVQRFRASLEDTGGSLVLERGAAQLTSGDARTFDSWGNPGGAFATREGQATAASLMRDLKKALDPAGVFVSGRLPSGL
jgi:glycolate oxidase FAD binding subunit